MKKLTLLIAALVTGLIALAPANAEARDFCGSTRVTCERGTTCYWEYRRVGFDCDGCPIYRWVIVRTVCPPSYPSHDHGHGHGGHGHGRGHGDHGHGHRR